MKKALSVLVRCGWFTALALGLHACESSPERLARLEAVQQAQARELADLRQQLAEKEDEVAQLETCVDDLESAVYEDDSTTYEEDSAPRSTQL
ncbi:MAG: hypothetical protein JWR44_3567 [Hymenobacter sp.]|nr:hypothetical protein [Hymenobacter sp.]